MLFIWFPPPSTSTILPRQPVVQSTAETPSGPLLLDVYPGEGCAGTLYDDDGHSLAFTRGDLLRQSVRCATTPDGLVIRFERREGRYRPWWRRIAVTVHGWSGGAAARIGRRPLVTRTDAAAATVAVDLPDQPGPVEVAIERR